MLIPSTTKAMTFTCPLFAVTAQVMCAGGFNNSRNINVPADRNRFADGAVRQAFLAAPDMAGPAAELCRRIPSPRLRPASARRMTSLRAVDQRTALFIGCRNPG
jgi:hypothetical protein